MSGGGVGKADSRIMRSLSSWVMAVRSPLIRGLALSSGRGVVYLAAVHTSSLVAFSKKLFQQAFFARLMARRSSRRAALVAPVRWLRSLRLAFPSSFLSSAISSFHQRLDRIQTLLGVANWSRMVATVSRIHRASSATPSLVPTAGPRMAAAFLHILSASCLASFLFSCSSAVPSVFLKSRKSHPVTILLVGAFLLSSTTSQTRIS